MRICVQFCFFLFLLLGCGPKKTSPTKPAELSETELANQNLKQAMIQVDEALCNREEGTDEAGPCPEQKPKVGLAPETEIRALLSLVNAEGPVDSTLQLQAQNKLLGLFLNPNCYLQSGECAFVQAQDMESKRQTGLTVYSQIKGLDSRFHSDQAFQRSFLEQHGFLDLVYIKNTLRTARPVSADSQQDERISRHDALLKAALFIGVEALVADFELKIARGHFELTDSEREELYEFKHEVCLNEIPTKKDTQQRRDVCLAQNKFWLKVGKPQRSRLSFTVLDKELASLATGYAALSPSIQTIASLHSLTTIYTALQAAMIEDHLKLNRLTPAIALLEKHDAVDEPWQEKIKKSVSAVCREKMDAALHVDLKAAREAVGLLATCKAFMTEADQTERTETFSVFFNQSKPSIDGQIDFYIRNANFASAREMVGELGPFMGRSWTSKTQKKISKSEKKYARKLKALQKEATRKKGKICKQYRRSGKSREACVETEGAKCCRAKKFGARCHYNSDERGQACLRVAQSNCFCYPANP